MKPTRAVSGDHDSQVAAAIDSLDLTEKTLGEFRILRRIGRGGMAEVYLAQQTSLNRNVALKVLRAEFVTDETYLKRFRTEALAAAGLNHRNIVQVYSIGSERGIEFIAQEYVQGHNLRQFLVRKGPPDLLVALHIMKQVAAALHVAGQAGIVHRDIKPENILVTRKGEVKVADFGLAQLTLKGERVNLTQVGITMGTPLYMSPEQVNGSKVDHPSDIYSFGVTAYHLLAGSPPFRGQTAMSVAAQHLKNEPPPLEKSRPDLPILLCRIVHKMMAKDLKERYRTADAVLQDLKRVAKQEEEGGGSSNGSRAMPMVEVDEHPSTGLSQSVESMLSFPDRPISKQAVPFLIAASVLFAVGFAAAWLAMPTNPLKANQPAEDPQIPIKGDVVKQFYYAMNSGGSEAAWRAVIDQFSEETIFSDRAKMQLALLYLREDRLDQASDIFVEFIAAPDSEKENRVFGFAGKAVVLHSEREFQKSQQVLIRDVLPLHENLRGRMLGLVREVGFKNSRMLKKDATEGFKRFLEGPSEDENGNEVAEPPPGETP